MKTIQRFGFAALLLAPACYDGHSGAPGDDDGLADGADGQADGADGQADGGDDGEVPPRAGDDDPGDDGPLEDPFVLPIDEVQLIPFPVRMANLAAVASVGLDHPMFFKAYDLRLLLGDHDYSQLEAPDLRWTAERMQNWVKAVKPVCASTEMHVKFPDLVADPTAIMRAAFGRDPGPEDLEPMLDIESSVMDEEAKFQLACIAVLSSLEFVAY